MFRSLQRRKVYRAIDSLQKMAVSDAMSRFVVSVRPDDTVIHCATKMIAEDISCMVVMEGDELRGIISERDFLTKVPLNKNVFGMAVREIMTPDVVTVGLGTLLPEAVGLMRKKNFRRLVVAEDGKVCGIVTQTDFSRLLSFPVFPDGLKVGDIMSGKVLTASPKDSFSAARERMKRQNVGSIVIAEHGIPVGIFTEYDVVMQFYDQRGQLRLKELSNYMRKHVRAVERDFSVFDANRLLLEKRMRRLPVVEGEKLVGVVTQTDIIRYAFTNLGKIKKLAGKDDATFRKASKSYEGEFRGERLKVYG